MRQEITREHKDGSHTHYAELRQGDTISLVSVPDFGPKEREAAEQRMLDYAGRKLSRLGMRLHDPQFKLSYSSTGLAFLNLTAIALNRDYCRLDRFILSDGAWIED